MAIDLNRFIATFFDEAHEHLEAIEERAMTLGSGKQDPEVLNAIFRAAHSIKGGSGTFGFTQLTETTHEMETLFDALRKGKGKADESTVRLLLDACDVFKSHLARLKEGEKGNDPAMDALRAQFIGYRAGNATGPAAAAARPAEKAKGTDKGKATEKAKATEENFFADAEATAIKPAPAAGAKKEGTAFGFFDDLPAAAPAEATVMKAAETTIAKPATEKYGFFDP